MVGIILRNIANGFKKYTGFMIVLLIVEISAVITMFFSYGVYLDYLNQKNDDILGARAISAWFEADDITVGAIKDIEKDIESIFEGHLDSLRISTRQGNIQVVGVHEYKSSEYFFTDQTVRQLVEKGRYFSEAEETDGERVCLSYWEDERGLEYCGISYKQIGILSNWYGEDYNEVIQQEPEQYYVPYKSLPKDAVADSIEIHIDRRISAQMRTAFKELIEGQFAKRATIYEAETISETEEQLSEGMLIIIAIMFALAAINIYFLSQYLYERRKKMYAIFRICGANRAGLFSILFFENMIMVLFSTFFAYLLYDKCLVKILIKKYRYFDEIYTVNTYIEIAGGYLAAIIVLNIILAVKQLINTPVSMWRK